MAKDFTIEVYAFGERTQVIEACRECLLKFESVILDFKMFSDMLINFSIELPRHNFDNFLSELKTCGWKVESSMHSDGEKEVLAGFLSVNLASGIGKRKEVIPAVPG